MGVAGPAPYELRATARRITRDSSSVRSNVSIKLHLGNRQQKHYMSHPASHPASNSASNPRSQVQRPHQATLWATGKARPTSGRSMVGSDRRSKDVVGLWGNKAVLFTRQPPRQPPRQQPEEPHLMSEPFWASPRTHPFFIRRGGGKEKREKRGGPCSPVLLVHRPPPCPPLLHRLERRHVVHVVQLLGRRRRSEHAAAAVPAATAAVLRSSALGTLSSSTAAATSVEYFSVSARSTASGARVRGGEGSVLQVLENSPQEQPPLLPPRGVALPELARFVE